MTPTAFGHTLTEILHHKMAGATENLVTRRLKTLRRIAAGNLVGPMENDEVIDIANAAVAHGVLKRGKLESQKGTGTSGLLMQFLPARTAYQKYLEGAYVEGGTIKIPHAATQ